MKDDELQKQVERGFERLTAAAKDCNRALEDLGTLTAEYWEAMENHRLEDLRRRPRPGGSGGDRGTAQ